MGNTYMRIEATGFDHTVYDSNDISTIRGGSFLLLDTVEQLGNCFPDRIEKITTGASVGLFRVKNGADPSDLKKDIVSHLNEVTEGHATFVLDFVDSEKQNFSEIRALLTARNRYSQMRQLDIPWGQGWHGSKAPCQVNGILPGVQEKNKELMSASVLFRKDKGIPLRDKIYEKIIGADSGLNFTDHLEELGTIENGNVPENVNGKIAFIYLDGNKFGTIRQKYCQNKDKLIEYDEAIQNSFRSPVFKNVVDHMQTDPLSMTDDGKIRLETLLWGGDEIEWVVPAWKGLDILRLFFKQALPEFPIVSDGVGQTVPLTHAAGIVFCHCKAPILQIRKLARNLADIVKFDMKSIPGSTDEGNLFHYLVLESFDMLEGDTQAFLEKFYRPCRYNDLKIKGSEIAKIMSQISQLKQFFPRSKVYQIIDALKQKQEITELIERGLSDCMPDQKKTLKEAIDGITLQNQFKWFMIADLWDFVTEG